MAFDLGIAAMALGGLAHIDHWQAETIGEQLMISKRTVDNHVSNVFSKTGAKNRVALLNWAMDHGKICRDGFNCCSVDLGQARKPMAQ